MEAGETTLLKKLEVCIKIHWNLSLF